MSTRQVRSMADFSRFGLDIELACDCGHKTVLPYRPVLRRFMDEGWPKGLGSAAKHFRCRKCGDRPERIGPAYR